jgi:hypothetical protein
MNRPIVLEPIPYVRFLRSLALSAANRLAFFKAKHTQSASEDELLQFWTSRNAANCGKCFRMGPPPETFLPPPKRGAGR